MLARSWQNLKYESIKAVNTRGLSVAWQSLSRNALQPAGFNSPELMFPILRRQENVKLATVTECENLLLAMPLVTKRFYSTNVTSPLLASALPHLTKTGAAPVLFSFLQAQTRPILMRGIPSDSPFFDTLKSQSHHFQVVESWQRAVLNPKGKFEDWMQTNFDQKRRKEFKRLRSRLSELGELSIHVLGGKDNPTPFVDDFLTIEAAGWKGRNGTAIDSDPNLSKSLHEAALGLHQNGKLRFWSLKLNGKAIASLFAIVEGRHAWLGKIAYDESYAKYSPGVMIILDCTESFFLEKAITLVDSSAIPNHPMIDHIWRDRIPMATVLVAPQTISAKRFDLIVKSENLQLQTRSYIRDLYHKIMGTKRS
jgi:CelD/BcsL family acetyltransferase involved in cellulose biosynthesis